jgi:hypothetical protein
MKLIRPAILLVAIIAACRSMEQRKTPEQIATAILTNKHAWLAPTRTANKFAFERRSATAESKTGIYIEIADAPSGILLQQFVSALMENYRSIYQNVKYKEVKKKGLMYGIINHSIASENKLLTTTVIPEDQHFLLVVHYTTTSDPNSGRDDYDQLVAALMNSKGS